MWYNFLYLYHEIIFIKQGLIISLFFLETESTVTVLDFVSYVKIFCFS